MRSDPVPARGAGASWIRPPLLLLLALGCACGPEPERSRPARAVPLAVQVYADTGRAERLEVRPPPARVWLARVAPARLAAPAPELPEAEFESGSLPPIEPAAPALEVDAGLKPPVLRAAAPLVLPRGGRRRARVELDVRVDETGRVSDASWAGGSADTALSAAARRCALAMRFYPALRGGKPVAVWCRQRFDLGSAGR
jgi:TonB family protein